MHIEGDLSEGDKKDYLKINMKMYANYINVPLIVRYNLNDKFSLDFGPQIGFNVYSSLDSDGASYKVNDWVNKVDLSLSLGTTYYFAKNTFLQLRYNFGITKAAKYVDYDIDSPLISQHIMFDMLMGSGINEAGKPVNPARNQSLQLSIGYMF